tara:strand:- start:212 stop:1303 length:1092 start_codon:yes stop_codon:yes gene_type:complete
MNILLIGRQTLQSGGPAAVMNNIKFNLEKSYKDKVDILDISRINFLDTIYAFFFNELKKKKLLKIDVIHFHELWNINIIILMFKASLLGIPYIMTFHGVLNDWSMKKRKFIKLIFLKMFSKYIFKFCNGLHFLTKQEYLEVSKYSKYINEKAFVLQNGVVINKNIKLRKKNNKSLKLLYLGRIHPKKGIQDLIKVFKKIKINNDKIYLKIIGPDSDFYNEIKNDIKKQKLEELISFENAVYKLKEKRKYYALSDFFILPSYDEADSMAIKESISNGLPVIITKECKFELVEKENLGFMINHNVDVIYKTLIRSFKIKKQELPKMSKACLEFSKNSFDINKISSNYRNLMLEIISGVKYSKNWK